MKTRCENCYGDGCTDCRYSGSVDLGPVEVRVWCCDDEEANYSRCPVEGCGRANREDRAQPYISRTARTSDSWCKHLIREEGEDHIYLVP